MINWNNSLFYEQPINELTRLCLRFERLFAQIDHYIQSEGPYDSRAALIALLEILNLADRPDLKTNLSKELSRLSNNFNRYQHLPEVNYERLSSILKELSVITSVLNDFKGKFGHKLRENDFLSNIHLQLLNPGGACAINNPSLNYWLHQPYSLRRNHLLSWLEETLCIRHTITLILRLVRNSSQAKYQTAYQGFYEKTLDYKQPNQLIRVQLPANTAIYPEISAGRHRLCIHFWTTDFAGYSKQTNKDITFQLSCCTI